MRGDVQKQGRVPRVSWREAVERAGGMELSLEQGAAGLRFSHRFQAVSRLQG